MKKPVRHVEWDKQVGQYWLFNDDGGLWNACSPDGAQRFTAQKGQSLPLLKGYFIHFGDGKRLAIVVEDGKIAG